MTAHPLANDQSPQWELDYRPQVFRRIVIAVAIVVFIIHVLWAVILTRGDSGVYLDINDQMAYIAIGIIWALLLSMLLRVRVRAGKQGIEITRLLGPRLFPWDVVWGVSFPRSSPWARLELPADEHVGIVAIQALDKDRAAQAMSTLRELESKYCSRDRDSKGSSIDQPDTRD